MNISQAIPKAKRVLSIGLSWSRKLFLPIAIGFIAYSAFRASGSLKPLLNHLSPSHLLPACLCWSLTQWLGPLSTTALARTLSISLKYRDLALIAILRIPAKYLPGGIWQSVARFSAYRSNAISNTHSFAILVIEHIVALGTSAALGSGILLFQENASLSPSLLSAIFAASILLLVLPMLWLAYSQASWRKHLPSMLAVFASATLFWCLAGLAFLLYWAAILGLTPSDVPAILSGYLLSWAAGFAAVFAPQGIGVFEWSAAHLLPSAWSISTTVTALAGFRLVTITGDLLAWATGLLLSKRR